MKKRYIPAQLLFFVLLLFGSSTFAQQEKEWLTVDRYLSWEDVQNPQLSPDNKQIIYSRRWVDAVNDDWETSLWIMNSDGTKNRFLVDGSSPKWSPDGSTIAFQMLVAPDEDSSWKIKMPPKPKKANWTENPTIIERLKYRRDRVGYHAKGYRHIFLIHVDGSTPRRLTHGNWHHDSFKWMANGKTIVFESLRIKDAEYAWRESEIYSVNISSGKISQLSKRKGPDHGPVPSPDGQYIAYTGHDWSDDSYIEEGLYIMKADGSKPKKIAEEMGRRPSNLIWSEDGSGVYFTTAMNGTSNIYYATLSGKTRPITKGKHILRISDIGKRGLAVGTLSSSQVPKNLISLNIRKPSQMQTLYVSNKTHLAEVKLGEVEEIW